MIALDSVLMSFCAGKPLTCKAVGRKLDASFGFAEGAVYMGMHKRCAALWCGLVCGMVLQVNSPSLMAQDTAGAMLTARGDVAVNGRPVTNSQALLPGDLAVTQKDGGGNLTQGGTNAVLGTDTALRYETTYAVLERGGVSVNTQRGFAVQAGCWTVKPQQWDAWTDFAVSYSEGGQVLIQARGADVRVYGRMQRPHDKDKKSDVSKLVDADRDRDVNGAPLGNLSGTAVQEPQTDRGELLRAGQETKREACPAAAEQARQRPTRGGAASAASTGPLNSQAALYVGSGLAAGVVIWFLIPHHEDPVSPMKP